MTEEITDTVQTAPVEQNHDAARQLATSNLRLGGDGDYGLTVFGGSDSFALAQRMAKMLAWTTLVPEPYQAQTLNKQGVWIDNPCAIGNCVIALEIATRLRLSPLMVMQNLDVVKGRPGFRGAFVAALVNGSPLFSRLRYEFSGEGKEYGCRAYATDSETSEVLYGTKIDMKMVTGEGWDKNTKWTTMRDQMFMYRAATFWSRVHAPDLLLGMQTAEELEDVEPRLINERQSVSTLNERLRQAQETEPAADATNPQEPAADKPRRTRRAATRAPLDQEQVTEKPATQAAAPDGIDAGAVGEPAAEQISGIDPIETEKPDDATAADTSFDVE